MLGVFTLWHSMQVAANAGELARQRRIAEMLAAFIALDLLERMASFEHVPYRGADRAKPSRSRILRRA
jgi:hypothetical protein